MFDLEPVEGEENGEEEKRSAAVWGGRRTAKKRK